MKSDKIGGSLHAGLTKKMPSGDSGARPSGGRVDQDPTRSSVAKTPRTLGPRTA